MGFYHHMGVELGAYRVCEGVCRYPAALRAAGYRGKAASCGLAAAAPIAQNAAIIIQHTMFVGNWGEVSNLEVMSRLAIEASSL